MEILRGPRLPRAVRDRALYAAVRGGAGLRSRLVRQGRGGAETHRFDGVRRGEEVLQEQGILVPPVRKNQFMQTKWFGPCRRTANDVLMEMNGVSCRVVGFDDVVLEAGRSGGVVVRTR